MPLTQLIDTCAKRLATENGQFEGAQYADIDTFVNALFWVMWILIGLICYDQTSNIYSLIPRPHPLTRRNGLVNQVEFLGLAHAFATM